jgi:hypothetical protein
VPFTVQVEPTSRWVIVRASGVLTLDDFQRIQDAVWAVPEAEEYDRVLDYTEVLLVQFGGPFTEALEALGMRASVVDHAGPSVRMALVAPQPWLYGLFRMYVVFRLLQHPRELRVFRHLSEALAWLAPRGKGTP